MIKLRKDKAIELTRGQAMQISYCLERLRLNGDEYPLSNREIRALEDAVDSQLWGSEYVANRVQIGA